MSAELFRCACGTVHASIDLRARHANRVICYCGSCQAFAHYVGRGAEILDANGGTDITQISQARIAFTAGAQHLACVQLTSGGPLRWFTDCCQTPIGNTPAKRRLPLIGLLTGGLRVVHGQSIADLAGPIRGIAYTADATGDTAHLPPADQVPWRALLRGARVMLGAKLRGAARRSPFFDPATGAPVVRPRTDELQDD